MESLVALVAPEVLFWFLQGFRTWKAATKLGPGEC
jgi:hypothetical protein